MPGRSWSAVDCAPRFLLRPSGTTHRGTGASIGERQTEGELEIAGRQLHSLCGIGGFFTALSVPGQQRIGTGLQAGQRKSTFVVGRREVSIGQDEDDRRHPVMDVTTDFHYSGL